MHASETRVPNPQRRARSMDRYDVSSALLVLGQKRFSRSSTPPVTLNESSCRTDVGVPRPTSQHSKNAAIFRARNSLQRSNGFSPKPRSSPFCPTHLLGSPGCIDGSAVADVDLCGHVFQRLGCSPSLVEASRAFVRCFKHGTSTYGHELESLTVDSYVIEDRMVTSVPAVHIYTAGHLHAGIYTFNTLSARIHYPFYQFNFFETSKHTSHIFCSPSEIMSNIQKVAIIGCGSIGASWAALFLAQGLTVSAFDINPAAQKFLENIVSYALPVLSSLGLLKKTDAKPSDILFTTTMEDALKGADFVQENGPERLQFKQELFDNIAKTVAEDTIIATSSSGLTCSSIQEGMQASSHPERCVVGHPFNPPHLIPLVEVVGGRQTSADVVSRTMAFYSAVGKKPVEVKKEVVGHVANRLQAALMREMMYLLQEDVATVSDLDTAMSFGPGLRWGVMGPSTLFHLGGGEGGIRHMADHLLGPLMSWYAPRDPVVDDALRRKWVDGTIEEVGGRDYRELARQRDEELVRLLNVRNEWDGFAERKKSE